MIIHVVVKCTVKRHFNSVNLCVLHSATTQLYGTHVHSTTNYILSHSAMLERDVATGGVCLSVCHILVMRQN